MIFEVIKKKWAEYLLEMLVIVIGIVAAFMLNSWKEERRQKGILQSIYKVIHADMVNDTAEVSLILDYYNRREGLFASIINDSISREEFKACSACPYLISNVRTLYVDASGYQQLVEFNNLNNTQDDTLIFQIVQLYSIMIKRIENYDDEIRKDALGNAIEWRDKFPWLANMIGINRKIDDSFYDYALDEPFFRNKVAFHYILVYNNYLNVLRSFDQQVRAILTELEKRI